jgi:hypothetical protein
MKNLFFRMLLLVVISWAGVSSSAAITIVSDLDDTIKQTNVKSKWSAVCNGLLSKRPFGGMATLYREVAERVFIVSGKAESLRGKVQDFLDQNQFSAEQIFLRSSFFADLGDFKTKALNQVLNITQGPVILIGDDTQLDPEIMSKVKSDRPDRVVAVYIRHVQNRTVPRNVVQFVHPFEIAVHEWSAGRISSSQLLSVARENIVEMREAPDLYFADFAHCPKTEKSFRFDPIWNSGDQSLIASAQTIIKLSLNFCRN